MDDIIKIEPNELRTEMQKLRAEGYDFMRSLTGMDWGEEGLGVVYHLEKTATGENKVIKLSLPTARKLNCLQSAIFGKAQNSTSVKCMITSASVLWDTPTCAACSCVKTG